MAAAKSISQKNIQRECRGVIRGGAIRLAEHDPDAELIIGEGIESTLSAMQIFDLPGWSAVFAGGLKTIELPSIIRRIIIAADNDASGAGQRNALAAYDRWTAEGRTVRLKAPPVVGSDFNDLLSYARACPMTRDTNREHDADPDAWRKEFWSSDASAKAEEKREEAQRRRPLGRAGYGHFADAPTPAARPATGGLRRSVEAMDHQHG